MGHRGVIRVAVGSIAIVCGLAMIGRPCRYVVEGVSMAPGLRPGDVVETGWLSQFGRWREPRRHERWIIVSPDGGAAINAIKRIVGLPGETVSIPGGDLAIGGRVVLTPPRVLAEVASMVPQSVITSKYEGGDDGRFAAVTVAEVLDEAPFAPAERRVLLPVRDVGFTAVIDLRTSLSRDTVVRVALRVGRCAVHWRVRDAGRFAFVAGRLDGRLVGLAWPLADCDAGSLDGGRVLPPQVPTHWDVARPWPDAAAVDDDDSPATLSVNITGDGSCSLAERAAVIEQFVVWRDVLYRPAADGIEEWRLGPDGFFVLGDFPSGSRDSRQWGPLSRGAFRAAAIPKR